MRRSPNMAGPRACSTHGCCMVPDASCCLLQPPSAAQFIKHAPSSEREGSVRARVGREGSLDRGPVITANHRAAAAPERPRPRCWFAALVSVLRRPRCSGLAKLSRAGCWSAQKVVGVWVPRQTPADSSTRTPKPTVTVGWRDGMRERGAVRTQATASAVTWQAHCGHPSCCPAAIPRAAAGAPTAAKRCGTVTEAPKFNPAFCEGSPRPAATARPASAGAMQCRGRRRDRQRRWALAALALACLVQLPARASGAGRGFPAGLGVGGAGNPRRSQMKAPQRGMEGQGLVPGG